MDRLTLSDERLMTLTAGGDQQAFQALVRRMGSAILTVTTRMLCDDAAAEEAFVDVVAKMWMGRQTYQGDRPVRPWVMAIAANACREQLRRARRLQGAWDRPITPPAPLPDAGMADDESSALLRAALLKLPDKQRDTLVLRLWGGLDYQHIAEALNVYESTARSNMHHALAALRGLLGSKFGEETRSQGRTDAQRARSGNP